MGIILHGVFDEKPHPKTVAVITCGGSGTRMGLGYNKLFMSICDKPVIAYTLDAFETCPLIDSIVIVAHPNEIALFEEIVEDYEYSKVLMIVSGGKTRQESVSNGISVIDPSFEIVCVHDGARPLITSEEIIDTINCADKHGSACSGIYSKDTVKKASENIFTETLNREELFLVRTPQTFKREIIEDIFKTSAEKAFVGTDESSLAELCGYKVHAVEGKSTNIKLTDKNDYYLISAYLTCEED